jgi:transcriptional regulator with XRE-family HTH domain
MTQTSNNGRRKRLSPLQLHRRFYGMFSRVARRLGVAASYVSMVARGKRKSETIERALENEVSNVRCTEKA